MMIKEALRAGEGDTELVIPDPDDRTNSSEPSGGVSVANLLEDLSISGTPEKALSLEKEPVSAIKARIAMNPLSSVGTNSSNDLLDFDDQLSTDMNGSQATVWGAKSTSGLIPISPRTFGVGIPEAGQTIRAFNPGWESSRFFDSLSGRYVCTCGHGFVKLEKFEEHLIHKAQKNQRVRYVL